MNIFASVALLLSLFSAQGLSYLAIDIPPETVSELDPDAYSGRWFQVYTSLIPKLSYEKHGFCVVADYLLPVVTDSSASFYLVNSENKGSPTGELKQACGHATNDHYADSPGEFRLTFDNMHSPIAGFYWIVRLGEIEAGQTLYPWAIVSVPFQTSVFILARDVSEFKLKYEADVLALVRELGFKYFFNKPLETAHSAECKYPPVPKNAPPKPEPPPKSEPPALTTKGDVEVEVQDEDEPEELVELEADEFEHRNLKRTKADRPSPDRTKRPKPPSLRRTKQPKPPSVTRPPRQHKTKPPSDAPTTEQPPSPPPQPAKHSPPPTEGKPEPPPSEKPPPPPPPPPTKGKPEPPPSEKPPPPPEKLATPPPPPKKPPPGKSPPRPVEPPPSLRETAASPTCD